MANNFVNNASVAVLDVNISSSATSVTVTNFSGWPISTPFWAEIGRDTSSSEVVKVTAVAGSVLTISRGQDGTSGSAHNIGDKFEHVIPAYTANLAETHPEATTAHGTTSAVVGKDDAQTLTAKTYRGAHVHTYTDANPAAPASGYQVNADSNAARDGFRVNNTAADVNKRAFAVDQSGTPRTEIYNDGTVKVAPVGAARDALDVDGVADISSNLKVGGNWLATGTRFQPTVKPTVQVFTANGTWTKPADLVFAVVECVGGGGAGGGTQATTTGQASCGGGGGGGAYSRSVLNAGALGATEAVTIGAGGNGASAAGGGAGGATSFGAHVVANGGGGGAMKGAGTTMALRPGGAGGEAATGTGQVKAGGSPGGLSAATSNARASGGGGSSALGGGGDGRVDDLESAGRAYGGGGAGRVNSESEGAKTGKDGAAGVVIVTEYYCG